jgi:predicted RNA binding protein YcfA (HicA-like mRNA interferase family)
MQFVKRKTISWLLRNNFVFDKSEGGHLKYIHQETGCRVTILGNSHKEMTHKHAVLFLREIIRAGFDPEVVKEEILLGKKINKEEYKIGYMQQRGAS